MKVRDWVVRVVLNSKAEPNVEVCVNGFCSSPPSGTSRSSKEVEPWPRGFSLVESVMESARKIRDVLRELEGREVEPLSLEKEMLENGWRKILGGNGFLALVIPLYKAAAQEEETELWKYLSETFGTEPGVPAPLENIIGGGKHGGGSDVQEFLLYPQKVDSMEEAILSLSEAYREVKGMLKKVDLTFEGSLTLESAWVTHLHTEDILSLLRKVADEHGFGIGMDVAASDIFSPEDGVYNWAKEGVIRDREAQISYMEELVERFGVGYLEDPLEENDVDGFVELQKRLNTTVVGDDLFATNPTLLREGVGGAIIKYNQRGSILETVEAVKRAKELGMKVIVSHRSGETEDTFLSHFAVAMGADMIKAGAAGIRIVKLNELLRIFS